MLAKRFGGFIVCAIALTLALSLTYAGLGWLGVPTGTLVDWAVGGITLWWLLVITTVPWDLYFEAKDVIAEATDSRERGITIEAAQVRYAERIAYRSLAAAIHLHAVSAIALYLVASYGISRVGYVGAGGALLLTGLRPASRAYDYLCARLAAIRNSVKHPREDVVELRERLAALEVRNDAHERQLDEEAPDSFAATSRAASAALRRDLERVSSDLDRLRVENRRDHERIAHDAERAVAQVSTDGQVLDHVREIVRFFKTA